MSVQVFFCVNMSQALHRLALVLSGAGQALDIERNVRE